MTAAIDDPGPWEFRAVRARACGMVAQVRDQHPAQVRLSLADMDRYALMDMVLCLAAMVDGTRTTAELLRWTTPDKCSRGHYWTPANTRIERSGARRCRSCDRERQRAKRAARLF